MAHQGSSRPLRPLAPRTTSGLVPATPDPSTNEEHKVKRASMACAECKRRRTKVLAFINHNHYYHHHLLLLLFLLLLLLLSSFPPFPSAFFVARATRRTEPTFGVLFSHICSSAAMIPQEAPAPNVHYKDVNVSSMSPPTNVARLPPSVPRRRINALWNA